VASKSAEKLFHIEQIWHCFSSTLLPGGKVQVGLSGHSCPGILRFMIFNKSAPQGNPEVFQAVLIKEAAKGAETEPGQAVADTPKFG
jgi:hypothetical protein